MTPPRETVAEHRAPAAPTDAPASGRARSIPRKEDGRLLKGQGQFADDVWMHRMGHVHFVRSPLRARPDRRRRRLAARWRSTASTRRSPARRSSELTRPATSRSRPSPAAASRTTAWPSARSATRASRSRSCWPRPRELARDAAALVEVEYEPLPRASTAVEAADADARCSTTRSAPTSAGTASTTSATSTGRWRTPTTSSGSTALHFHRFSSTPLECNAARRQLGPGHRHDPDPLQQPDAACSRRCSSRRRSASGADQLVFRLAGHRRRLRDQARQLPEHHRARAALAQGRPAGEVDRVPLRAPARLRPRQRAHLPRHRGRRSWPTATILGFKRDAFDDVGAYLHYEPLGGVIWSQVLPGCYRFKHLQVDYTDGADEQVPGRPQPRLLAAAAPVADRADRRHRRRRSSSFDPVELRKRNYVQPEEYPYETPERLRLRLGRPATARSTARWS